MRRTVTFLVTAAFALSLAGAAGAESCKDAKGKFVKCPAPAAAAAAPAKAGPCKDAKGKFTKCPAADAAPAAAPAAQTKVASAAPAAAAGGPKKCVKGKACGNTCISVK